MLAWYAVGQGSIPGRLLSQGFDCFTKISFAFVFLIHFLLPGHAQLPKSIMMSFDDSHFSSNAFRLPKDEKLDGTQECTMWSPFAKTHIWGTLFVSPNYLCFESRVSTCVELILSLIFDVLIQSRRAAL